jgi:hypothetical protein
MLAALQAQRLNLKPVAQQEPAPAGTSAGILGEDLDEEAQQRIRTEFFASGVEQWLDLLGELTFPTTSVSLNREACQWLARNAGGGGGGVSNASLGSASKEESEVCRQELVRSIDAALRQHGWENAFVKLSTRSPKDAHQILEKATCQFAAQRGETLLVNERVALFSQLVQDNFAIGCGEDAVALLLGSDRVREDLEYALEASNYEELQMHIVLRRWDGAIPIEREFRGIVWNGELNAIGQYYHPLHFPQLDELQKEISADLCEVYEELRPRLSKNGFTHCIIDFAWLEPQKVRVIEINPFDGVALGCFPGSTGLFRWDDEKDRRIITEGPFELRLRQAPQTEQEFKHKLSTAWRDVLFPTKRSGIA